MCTRMLRAGLKVKDTLRRSKYHLIRVGALCFQFNGLISQGQEVRGHKSGSWQMSVWFKFRRGDLMLTGERIWIQTFLSLHLDVKFVQVVRGEVSGSEKKENSS